VPTRSVANAFFESFRTHELEDVATLPRGEKKRTREAFGVPL
jgi:hypothetical protein